MVSIEPTESGMIFAESRILWLVNLLGEIGFSKLEDFVQKYGTLSERKLIDIEEEILM